jgi:hypothetical protein
MAENQKPASRGELVSLDSRRGEEVCDCLERAFDDHAEFESVMVVAVVSSSDSADRYCRVFTGNLNHLEKLGLLQKAIETVK